MANKEKQFAEEEKRALAREKLDWRYYKLVWRGPNSFIVRQIGSTEVRTVVK